MGLLDEEELQRSSVVANCCMNRERRLGGSNGYGKELRFEPLAVLRELSAANEAAAWLDLCCGSGRALGEAAELAKREGWLDRMVIVGVDLVRDARWTEAESRGVELIEASLSTWEPRRSFDLITCVHGLHYIGDKLGLILRAASWLTKLGRLVANLDLDNLKIEGSRSAARSVTGALRSVGIEYDSRRKLVSCAGGQRASLPFEYLGADDLAGPNYTGQAAVDSYYRRR